MSELERLRYENRMLKAQLTQQQMEIGKQAVQTGCDVQLHGGVAGRGWTAAGAEADKNCGAIKEILIFIANRKS